MGTFSIVHWIIVAAFMAVFIIPTAKILRRTGHSGWWSLLYLVPLLNIIALWVFASVKWPKVDGVQAGAVEA